MCYDPHPGARGGTSHFAAPCAHPDREDRTMQHSEIVQYARSLYDAHGDRAEAEAARKSSRFAAAGETEEARTWEKIRLHIKELRGPRAK
jgi:hypothetical protein